MEAEPVTDETPRVRPPKQARSQLTLDRICTAALELMEEQGVEGTTVAAIVSRAGASVGSFYARFAGKEELVRFLQDRIWTEARERWDAALDAEDWASLSISSVLEGVIGLLLTSYRADFRRRRALGRGWGGGERSQHFTTFHEHLLSTVIPLLLARERQITHPTPELGIRMGYRFAVGAIREVLDVEEVTGKQGEVFEDEELVRELARAWIGYLSPQALVGEEAEEDVDFFDPWG